MVLDNIKIIQVAYYAAEYKGNFVRSLEFLEASLAKRSSKICYVFPQAIEKYNWYHEIAAKSKVYLIKPGSESDFVDQFSRIFDAERPNLVHVHHDGYDIAVAKACAQYHTQKGKEITQVWHLRNVKGLSQKGWHKLWWNLKFFVHYGYYGSKANIISVNDYMLNFASKYKKMNFWTQDRTHKIALQNGIALSRIETNTIPEHPHLPFSFLAFGGRNVQKRIEVLLEAGQILAAENTPFRVLITKGTETESVASVFFKGSLPQWCILIDQNDNVNVLFAQADCFISTAIHETFCNAICEATVYGLPIIQSDIDGTMWNAVNPSVFLYRTLDSQALAKEMYKIIHFDRNRLIQNCLTTRHNNSSKYSFDKWCEKVEEFYCSL